MRAAAAAFFVIFLISSALFAANPSVKTTKKVVIYLLSQSLACYENDQVVYTTNICSGKNWHSTNHTKYKKQYWIIRVHGPKSRCVVKGKYNVSAPWKMELSESPTAAKGKLIRIHEFYDVPKVASSRGCLRVPLGKGKPINLWAKPDLPILVEVRLEKAPEPTKSSRR